MTTTLQISGLNANPTPALTDVFPIDNISLQTYKTTALQLLQLYVLNNAGNPNGAVAGTKNQLCLDTTNNLLYICTTTGTSTTAVWTITSNQNYATTATAAATTTLTVKSAQQQYFTGSTTQTVVLPVVSTLYLGQSYSIVNNSSGVVTVQSSGANTIQAMAAGTTLLVTCISLSGTTAASWNALYNLGTSNTLPANVSLVTPTTLGVQQQALNMNSHQINNVTDPTSAQDAATKNYVDQTALNGTSVYAASAATLGTVTQSGAGVGATLTNAGTQAIFALDGVNPPVGSNVLIKNTATGMTAVNEGVYTVTNVGSVSTNWVLTRANNFDTPVEINSTGLIIVQNGSTLIGTAWYNAATIVTVDTTNFSFSEFGNIVFPITLAHGGTGANLTASTGGIVYSGASALAILSGTATAGLALLSGANAPPTWSNLPPFSLISTQVLTGASNYTATAGTKYIWVRGVAGGGGSGSIATTVNASAGAGGGSGAYGEYWGAYSSPIAYSVGSAGAGGTSGGNTGGTGGPTTFGTAGALLNLGGGLGGTSATGTNAPCLGGAGGAVTTAAFGIPGGQGGMSFSNAGIGGFGGNGASSPLGAGGGGGFNGTGNTAGSGYGSGGGGLSGTAATAGANGAIGTLEVFEFG